MKKLLLFFVFLSTLTLHAEYVVYYIKGSNDTIHYNCVKVNVKNHSIGNKFPYEDDVAKDLGKVTEVNFFKTITYKGQTVSAIFKDEDQAVGYVNFKRGNWEGKWLTIVREKNIKKCINKEKTL